MKVIIDANLPNLSDDLITFLKAEFGLEEVKKIFIDTDDRTIYREAKRDGFDCIVTRDNDFEPFIENDLLRGNDDDKARGLPKIVFFSQNNGMDQDTLDRFFLYNFSAMKNFCAIRNPLGFKPVQYCTIAPEDLTKSLDEQNPNFIAVKEAFDLFKQGQTRRSRLLKRHNQQQP